jgi:hypothetical protein
MKIRNEKYLSKWDFIENEKHNLPKLKTGYIWNLDGLVEVLNPRGDVIKSYMWTKVTHARFGIQMKYFQEIVDELELCNYWEREYYA